MTHTEPLPAEDIRMALRAILWYAAHDSAETPRPSDLYLPPRHEHALNPNIPFVVADRGAGKSFFERRSGQ